MKNKLACAVLIILILLVGIPLSCVNKSNNNSTTLVMTSTTIVRDVVAHLAPPGIEVRSLLPAGVSPHGFRLRPSDMSELARARALFLNGLDLEKNLFKFLSSDLQGLLTISLSDSIALPDLVEGAAHEHHGAGRDPHVWMDPVLVRGWVDVIESVLCRLTPPDSVVIHDNAKNYRRQLDALHEWINDTLQVIPTEQRIIISDHLVLQYFNLRYGFRQGGELIEGFSTLSSATAGEMAALSDYIKQNEIPVIFSDINSDSPLARQICSDLGIRQMKLYTGSLGKPGSGVEDYILFMKYNVRTIINGLNLHGMSGD